MQGDTSGDMAIEYSSAGLARDGSFQVRDLSHNHSGMLAGWLLSLALNSEFHGLTKTGSCRRERDQA